MASLAESDYDTTNGHRTAYPNGGKNRTSNDSMLNHAEFATQLPRTVPDGRLPVNVNNYRLDAYTDPSVEDVKAFNVRTAKRKLCNNYHLQGHCPDSADECAYDHSPASPGVISALRQVLNGTPCPRKGGCRRLNCLSGHICQKADCKYRGGKTYCKFPPNVHTQDLELAGFVPGEAAKTANRSSNGVAREDNASGSANGSTPRAESEAEQDRSEGALLDVDGDEALYASSLYDAETADDSLIDGLQTIKQAEFVAWDRSFLEVIGVNAKLERIQSFPLEEDHVHEAPVFLPETNELLYSDTSVTGWLWAINVDTYETRKLHTTPALEHVNGGTSHNGEIYLATNGGHARGLYKLNATSGHAEAILNNYHGRHLNSPNDLIFDSASNILFTDPPYGWHNWPGVAAPELPNAIYHFNPQTGGLRALSNSVVQTPNGLALSPDESVLYVADSNSSLYSGAHLTSVRNVWAFDYRGGMLRHPRLVYQVESGWPDGLRVTREGLLMVAVAGGVDVVDPANGLLLGKINTPGDIIFNVEPVRGKSGGVWILTGKRHIYKVTIAVGGVEARGFVGIGGVGNAVASMQRTVRTALRGLQQLL
ncbi:hypothetical protein B0A55_10078 [Friedmanniomyces simplex]|uniref:C3H1-type domain-containing protein n=1 Tax=Friedmanniomyces simplex TaxID=329884 RepID=A0A4U0WKF3_9PEZI|nr:hypothetical protein B0A55_10078 [Friedmanniomyces simplex]